MEPWNRCDVCGQFVSYEAIADGKAKHRLLTPETEFTSETWETLCERHADDSAAARRGMKASNRPCSGG